MVELQVIGAGHGRTGTTSLRAALKKVLNGPCYHMDNIVVEGGIEDTATWLAMTEAKAKGDTATVVTLAHRVLDGHAAAIDWPPSIFYKELMIAYPNAKVILTMRDTKKWYTSVFDTLWSLRVAQEGTWMIKIVPFVVKFNHFIDEVVWKGPNSLWKGTFPDKEKTMKEYDAWIEEVKAHVPKERLLVFSVTDGYGPLCKFLGVPEPKEDFPNVNEKSRFENLIKIMKTADKVGKFVIAPLLVAGAAMGLRKLLR